MFLSAAALLFCACQALGDALPSWNPGAAKDRILAFVAEVTSPDSPGFVPPEERIAVFDNDGTLWAEQPFYFQLAFAIDRVKAEAPKHPEWADREPFKAAIEGDQEGLMAAGVNGMLELVMATHAGCTTEEFDRIVRDWIAKAKHPKLGRLYTECTYRPMLELLSFLRANGFKTFIVSGGGMEFLRTFSEPVYGIPPEQVVGSRCVTQFEIRDGEPVLMRLPKIEFIDDKEGKPVGIQVHIGRRPILAFGNSDGDLAMLQWTAAGKGPRLAALIHHTDADREWAYDRKSHIGKLDAALDEASKRGWLVVDMKADWNRVFPD